MILHHEFIKMAKKFGDKMAIIDKTTGKEVPYAKALIASLILTKKFGKYQEGYIGMMIPTSAGSFLTVLGIIMAGKVPVMINYSTGAANNCEYAQKKCGFKTIVTSRALCEKIGCRLVPGMVFLEDLMETITAGDKLQAALRSKLPFGTLVRKLPKADIEDVVVILFTSGCEKDPKAVQLTHKNIGSNIRDVVELFGLNDKDILMSILPLFHVFGYTVNFWLPMTTGMTAVTYANPLDYKAIPSIIREQKATMIAGTPIFFSGYLRESKPGDFETLRHAVAGADKCPDALRAGYKQKHNLDLLEGYGTTETSPVISVNLHDRNKPGSIGPPLPSVRVKIADLESGEVLPPNHEGKILVKGDIVMKGYFDDIEETSLRIENGWYDTGDMGMLDDDGFLWHRGRLKRFVKIGGEMVSLVKTENVLEQLLPDGVDCCIVEVPDSVKGARLIAAVTQKVSEKDLIKKMGRKLPPIEIPKQFIVIPDMPKLGSGKINFREITDIVQSEVSRES
ncbi:MAG TPA: bifunctional acyl-ACP--phospholipid O-acyltransferase/long-chain-fatty-acid--ACP ligase [bacterium]|nr:bifunctional acyl-ACP--phospholipid O-acyltransferase/long-chain-fatty-acid--ACP ligase [bacterium]